MAYGRSGGGRESGLRTREVHAPPPVSRPARPGSATALQYFIAAPTSGSRLCTCYRVPPLVAVRYSTRMLTLRLYGLAVVVVRHLRGLPFVPRTSTSTAVVSALRGAPV